MSEDVSSPLCVVEDLYALCHQWRVQATQENTRQQSVGVTALAIMLTSIYVYCLEPEHYLLYIYLHYTP